jgi:hypothetical protein
VLTEPVWANNYICNLFNYVDNYFLNINNMASGIHLENLKIFRKKIGYLNAHTFTIVRSSTFQPYHRPGYPTESFRLNHSTVQLFHLSAYQLSANH